MNVFPVLNNFTINFIDDSSIFFHGYWSFNCSCLEGQVWRPSILNYIWLSCFLLLLLLFFNFLTSTYVESYFTSWKFPTLAICLIIYNTLWSENWLFNAPLDVTLKIILSAFLPANFVTWMIMVLMVFSILFQDYEFNATNYRHKHSCAFSPCVQIWVFCCRSAPLAQRDDNFQNGGHEM